MHVYAYIVANANRLLSLVPKTTCHQALPRDVGFVIPQRDCGDEVTVIAFQHPVGHPRGIVWFGLNVECGD